MERVDWRDRAAKLFCLGVLLGGVYLAFCYAKTVIVVVAIVWGVSAAIDSLARKTARVTGLPRRLLAVTYLVLLLLLISGAIFLAARRLWEELCELARWLEENQGVIGEKIGSVTASVEGVLSRIPLFGTLGEGSNAGALGETVDTVVSDLIRQTMTSLGGALTLGVGALIRGTPRALIVAIVTLLGCFYLSMDYEGLRDRLIALLPEKSAHRADRFRHKARTAVLRFLRAYLLLMLLTFAVVFVGLWLLGRQYAFLTALLIALVDVLPILGVGTVLVPWAIAMILLKNYTVGFGLLILFGVATIVRQIAEPRLVGESLGIHPLVSLLFLFVGLELFGFFGMILGPAAALILKELLLPDGMSKNAGKP